MAQITSIDFFLRIRKRYRELKVWKSALKSLLKDNRKTITPILKYAHSLIIKNLNLPPPMHLSKAIDPVIGLAGEALYLAKAIGAEKWVDNFLMTLNIRRNFILQNILSIRLYSEKQIAYIYFLIILMLRLENYLPKFFEISLEQNLSHKLLQFIRYLNFHYMNKIENTYLKKILHHRTELFSDYYFSLNEFVELNSLDSKIHNSINIAMKSVLYRANTVINGEIGTGKRELAKLMHKKKKIDSPLFILNCADLKRGEISALFDITNKGTFFFEDIECLDNDNQFELLKILNRRKDEIKFDSHFIFGANSDMWQLVCSEKFKKELFYKIHTLCIVMPSLKERKIDIPFLAKLYIAKYTNDDENAFISKNALLKLVEHQWKGNFIEFENVIKSSLILKNENEMIKSSHIEFPEKGQKTSPRKKIGKEIWEKKNVSKHKRYGNNIQQLNQDLTFLKNN